MRENKNGQTVLDYTVFLVIILATLIIMSYYIKNRLAGSHREAADTFGTGEVYVPDIEGVSNPSDVTITYDSPIDEPSRNYMW